MQTIPHAHSGRRLAVSLGVSALAIVLLAPVASAAPPKTKLASQNNAGVQPPEESVSPEISATGRFVVFDSHDGNLVGGDTNDEHDVFIRDFKKGKTKLVSVAVGGGVGNDDSGDPTISASGRFIAFESYSSDLIGSDPNDKADVFVRDRVKNKTQLISQSSSGVRANDHSGDAAISGDGRWVAFETRASNLVAKDTKGKRQIYLYDRKNRKLILVSRNKSGKAGNSESRDPAISGNGRYIVYRSTSTNLTGTDTKGNDQIYKFDRVTKKTVLVSRNNKGKAGNNDSNNPAISGSGARVVFNSLATNFGKDTNGVADAYMRDRNTKKTKRVSLNWKGRQLNGGLLQQNSDPDISANGKWVAYESAATNATKGSTFSGAFDQIYARNLKTGVVKLISRRGARANDQSSEPELSKDGAFVAFESEATNLVAGGDSNGSSEDVFRRGPIN